MKSNDLVSLELSMKDKETESFFPDPMFNDPPEFMNAKECFWLIRMVVGIAAAVLVGLYLFGSL